MLDFLLMSRCLPSPGQVGLWCLFTPLLALAALPDLVRAQPAARSNSASMVPAAPPAPTLAASLGLNLRAATGQVLRVDHAQMLKLPQRRLRTSLPATLGIGGASEWEGVPLSAVLALLNLPRPPVTVTLRALNGYSVTIPLPDVQRYEPLLAYQRDGHEIAVRDKGPLILIYPFDRHPELNRQVYVNRTIWQVHEIVLE